MKELIEIQSRLNVPKNRKNEFGGFMYRSCEDILEAVKPLLKEFGCTLIISDTVKQVGDRYYVESTTILQNPEGLSATNTAYAREAESKKGLDEAQLTGSVSSYARKYALNGLFCIDDTSDPDNPPKNNPKPPKPKNDLPVDKGYPERGNYQEKLSTDEQIAIEEIKACKTKKELQSVYSNWGGTKNASRAITNACKEQMQKLGIQ